LQPENVATKALLLSENGDAVSTLQERTVTEAAEQVLLLVLRYTRKDVFIALAVHIEVRNFYAPVSILGTRTLSSFVCKKLEHSF